MRFNVYLHMKTYFLKYTIFYIPSRKPALTESQRCERFSVSEKFPFNMVPSDQKVSTMMNSYLR